MGNKCYTTEARKFEDKLGDCGITYNQFLKLCTMHKELTLAAKAEVDDMLREYNGKTGDEEEARLSFEEEGEEVEKE